MGLKRKPIPKPPFVDPFTAAIYSGRRVVVLPQPEFAWTGLSTNGRVFWGGATAEALRVMDIGPAMPEARRGPQA